MRLRQHRQAKGWTQHALAEKAGLTREYVNYLEHGKYDPTLGVLVRLAKALGTTVGGLLGERAPPHPPARARDGLRRERRLR